MTRGECVRWCVNKVVSQVTGSPLRELNMGAPWRQALPVVDARRLLWLDVQAALGRSEP